MSRYQCKQQWSYVVERKRVPWNYQGTRWTVFLKLDCGHEARRDNARKMQRRVLCKECQGRS